MKEIKFRKYHGCGNDFLIGRYVEGLDYSALAKKYCDRYLGIGADGLLLAKVDGDEVEMVFYNSDGSRAPMCGNGVRCFSLYCLDENLVSGKEFDINTLSGIMKVSVKSREPYICSVSLGKANFSSEKLDIATEKECFLDEDIELTSGKKIKVDAIYMATHHLVVIVDDLNKAIESGIAEEIGKNKIFKKGINVNLAQIIDKSNIKMKTFERGAGWTLACGTGASATYVSLRRKGLCDEKLNIHLEHGTLLISSINDEIIMEGPSICIASNIKFEI